VRPFHARPPQQSTALGWPNLPIPDIVGTLILFPKLSSARCYFRFQDASTLLTLLHSSRVRAAVHIGLPHEVLNFTQPIGVPQAVDVTVTQSYAVNYTATESVTTTQQCPTSSSTSTIYSIIFPSPDAAPIEITAQSQVVTSYVPEMTWCIAPPVQYVPISGAPFGHRHRHWQLRDRICTHRDHRLCYNFDRISFQGDHHRLQSRSHVLN
jgi:hypothetical protein